MPLDWTENAYKNSTWLLNCHFLQTSLYGPTQWPLYTFDVHSVKWQTLQTATWNSDRLSSFCCCNRYCWCKTSRKKPLRTINIALVTLRRRHLYHRTQRRNQRFQCSRASSQAEPPVTQGVIHSTKIPTGPTGKSGPHQKADPFFRIFSGWTEPIHWVLDRNFRKFWLNGSCPQAHYLYHVRDSYNMSKYREHVGRSLGLEIC